MCRVRALDDLTDIGDGQVAEYDCLQDTVHEVEPQAERTRYDDRAYDAKKLHQDKRTEYVTEKTECQRDRFDEKVDDLKGDHERLRIGERSAETLDSDETDRHEDDVDDREDRHGERERDILRRRRDMEDRDRIAGDQEDSDRTDHRDDRLGLLFVQTVISADTEHDIDQGFHDRLSRGRDLRFLSTHPAEKKDSDEHRDPCDDDRVRDRDLFPGSGEISLPLENRRTDLFTDIRLTGEYPEEFAQFLTKCFPEFRPPGSGKYYQHGLT